MINLHSTRAMASAKRIDAVHRTEIDLTDDDAAQRNATVQNEKRVQRCSSSTNKKKKNGSLRKSTWS
jgi:hypothetical protein